MIKIVHDISPIFVKISEVPVTKTRKAFVRHFLENKAYTSYSNLSCTQVQCSPGKNRSVTEIHQLTLSRFPKTSFEAVLRIIKELIDEQNGLRITFCTMINKVVVRYVPKSQTDYVLSSTINNYGKTRGADGYTLNEYLKVLNNLK